MNHWRCQAVLRGNGMRRRGRRHGSRRAAWSAGISVGRHRWPPDDIREPDCAARAVCSPRA